jgi:hypothetical protein
MRRLQSPLLFLSLFSLLLAGPSHASRDSTGWISEKIQELKDPARSDSEKREISLKIQAAGKLAIPPLIGCVEDPTPIAKIPMAGGECINRPGSLPIPPQCENPLRTLTLGERCEQLLYDILTPRYVSPYETRVPAKPISSGPFVVKNWGKWWKKYQNRSLEQIHQEARRKIDEFWLGGNQRSIIWK